VVILSESQQEDENMRRILGSCVLLALATPAHAGQQPQVSGSAPYAQAVNAATGTTTTYPGGLQTPAGVQNYTQQMPAAATPTGTAPTYYSGTYVATQQPFTPYGTAYGTTTYSSYPSRPFFGLFGRRTTPAYYYTTGATQGYTTQPQPYYYTPQTTNYTAQSNYYNQQPYNYTPARRMWPFGMFQRRYSAYPATTYTTSGYYSMTPGYYSTSPGYNTTAPGYYGTTTTPTAPVPAGTTYTPTMYTAPAGTTPSATNPLPPGSTPAQP
jgi:hypothetical protein